MDLIIEHPPDPLLEEFGHCLRRRGPELFRPGLPITAARGPARIDCMGGVADYSGSVVFEGPLKRAAVVAFQPREDGVLVAHSATLAEAGLPSTVEAHIDELRRDGRPRPYKNIRELLTREARDAWAAYIFGVLAVLETENVGCFDGGASFLLWSDVPIGVGVSSSAALEVAAMHAVNCHLGLGLPAERLAALCQTVENEVVGAPCGIMDQVTSACGQRGKLLALRCQPCELLGQHELPPGVRVFGLSSRVEHRVGGRAYAAARVSAFMGLTLILKERQARGLPATDRYLCNLTPSEYISEYRHLLPETISGADFLDAYGPTADPVTTVDRRATYRVRAGTDHPVFENARVQAFIGCLDRARGGDRTALVEAGGLMYASHCSYSWNCGLGCAETDMIVRLVQMRGPARGLYGAKITGGGSGGTVAVLADAGAEDAVRAVAADYTAETGFHPDIFAESGPGAFEFGPRTYCFEG
jgi:galactokinase